MGHIPNVINCPKNVLLKLCSCTECIPRSLSVFCWPHLFIYLLFWNIPPPWSFMPQKCRGTEACVLLSGCASVWVSPLFLHVPMMVHRHPSSGLSGRVKTRKNTQAFLSLKRASSRVPVYHVLPLLVFCPSWIPPNHAGGLGIHLEKPQRAAMAPERMQRPALFHRPLWGGSAPDRGEEVRGESCPCQCLGLKLQRLG